MPGSLHQQLPVRLPWNFPQPVQRREQTVGAAASMTMPKYEGSVRAAESDLKQLTFQLMRHVAHRATRGRGLHAEASGSL